MVPVFWTFVSDNITGFFLAVLSDCFVEMILRLRLSMMTLSSTLFATLMFRMIFELNSNRSFLNLPTYDWQNILHWWNSVCCIAAKRKVLLDRHDFIEIKAVGWLLWRIFVNKIRWKVRLPPWNKAGDTILNFLNNNQDLLGIVLKTGFLAMVEYPSVLYSDALDRNFSSSSFCKILTRSFFSL